MAQGQTTIDFGAFPGSTRASVVITGQTMFAANSLAEAFFYPVAATPDRTIEDQLYDIGTFDLYTGSLVVGVGFTNIPLYGQYNIGWVWNTALP